MAADYSICLGTAGWGVWHSPDAGKSWIRHRAPFPLNSRIQALVAHPKEAHTVMIELGLAMTDFGAESAPASCQNIRIVPYAAGRHWADCRPSATP